MNFTLHDSSIIYNKYICTVLNLIWLKQLWLLIYWQNWIRETKILASLRVWDRIKLILKAFLMCISHLHKQLLRKSKECCFCWESRDGEYDNCTKARTDFLRKTCWEDKLKEGITFWISFSWNFPICKMVKNLKIAQMKNRQKI